jgi:PAS domain S-box-containing protein
MGKDPTSTEFDQQTSTHQKDQPPPGSARRRYTDFFDFAPVGYFTFNRDGLILDVNPTGAFLLGADKPNLLNQHFSHFISPDSHIIFERHRRLLFDTRQKQTCDVKLMNGHKKTHWVQLESVAVENSQRDKEQFRTVIKEVTRRKQREDALLGQRDSFMNILDSMADGIYIINQEYDVEYANPTLIKEYGPVEGRKCYEYLADRNSVCPYCKNKEILKGKSVRWQWYSPKNKKTYDLMDTPLKNPDGSVWKLEIFRDITEYKKTEEALRKTRDELEQRVIERTAALETANEKLRSQVFECEMAEAALRESEHKYSSLVEDALIGVYIIKDGIIEFANDKFAQIYGYEKSELIGVQSSDLVHPEDRPVIEEMRQKRLEGEKVPSEYELRGLKKNGDTIWVMRSFSLINYKDGPAISGIVSDLTKRRKAEDALRESGKELRIISNQLLSAEEKERKRIARELHDGIGQALSAIKFSVENSLRQLREDSDQSELESLKAVIPLTQKTIEEVRRIVKDLRPSILDDLGILATINWFCREFQKVYTGIRIKSEIDVQENSIPSSHKTVIYRILQEALNNIAKHSRADLITLSLIEQANRVILNIQDNGVGFDVSKTISLTPSRRGFGLASMSERAGLSGADFQITSEPGKGTTIRVEWDV